MIAFASFGDAGLNYGDVDQQLVITMLTKFAIFIGILAIHFNRVWLFS